MDFAIVYLLHRPHSHLERLGNTVRVLFFEFSGAFNTLWPLLLGEKLSATHIYHDMVAWITEQQTTVYPTAGQSHVVMGNTGEAQDTLLSLFVFTIYTSDFSISRLCHLQKH